MLIAAAVFVGVAVWWTHETSTVPDGFTFGNGRLEATEIDVATKLPGRIAAVLVDEGDTVEAGQIVARIDGTVLEAELRQADAELERARKERAYVAAVVTQRESECQLARNELRRARALYEGNHISVQELERAETRLETAEAACAQASARLGQAEATIAAGIARTERIQAELDECILRAPRRSQVLFRLAEPGEVLPAGGKIATTIDLDDMYMTIFLPATVAGKVPIGADARIVLDALQNRPISAKVSFIADKAQFTPKEVETREEREKLMFRVKIDVLDESDSFLKPGMPGVAYVRLNRATPWPDGLAGAAASEDAVR